MEIAILTLAILLAVLLYQRYKYKKPSTNTPSPNIDISELYQNNPNFMNHIMIIEDCIRIINETKNIETGLSRIAVLKDNLFRIFTYIPKGHSLNLSIGSIQINSFEDIYKLDKFKEDWLESKKNK